jgi:hypothetical protein
LHRHNDRFAAAVQLLFIFVGPLGGSMLSGVTVLMLAQAAAGGTSYGPPEPARPAPVAAKAPADPCRTVAPSLDQRDIIVCAQRPEGYRIDPDVMKARKEYREHLRPKPPERYVDTSCRVVGPMGCGPPAGINLIGAALTAAEMAQRLAAGMEIGSLFVTDPQPSEYQLYLMAKAEREAAEAQKAGQAAAKAAAARPAPGPEPTKDSAGTAQQER